MGLNFYCIMHNNWGGLGCRYLLKLLFLRQPDEKNVTTEKFITLFDPNLPPPSPLKDDLLVENNIDLWKNVCANTVIVAYPVVYKFRCQSCYSLICNAYKAIDILQHLIKMAAAEYSTTGILRAAEYSTTGILRANVDNF